MLHFFIITDISLTEILQHTEENLIHIFMHQPAVPRCQHIVGAALFVQSERKSRPYIASPKENSILLRYPNSFGLAFTPSKI